MGHRVAIVESDDATRAVMEFGLRDDGLTVIQCSDIFSAARLLQHGRADVVVGDLSAPLADQLAESEVDLRRFVVVSEEPNLNGQCEKVFAVLRKPFDAEYFAAIVEACASGDRSVMEAMRRDESSLHSGLQRFLTNLRVFNRILGQAVVSDRDLLLCSEMRRTMKELASVFREAAMKEPFAERAILDRNASAIAARLGENAPSLRPLERDH